MVISKGRDSLMFLPYLYDEYDIPKTLCERVIASDQIPEVKKKELKKTYQSLNPADLKRKIDQKLMALSNLYCRKHLPEKGRQTKTAVVSSLIADQNPFQCHD